MRPAIQDALVLNEKMLKNPLFYGLFRLAAERISDPGNLMVAKPCKICRYNLQGINKPKTNDHTT